MESNSYQFDAEIGKNQALTIHNQIVSCTLGEKEENFPKYFFEIRNSNWKIQIQAHMLAFEMKPQIQTAATSQISPCN